MQVQNLLKTSSRYSCMTNSDKAYFEYGRNLAPEPSSDSYQDLSTCHNAKLVSINFIASELYLYK